MPHDHEMHQAQQPVPGTGSQAGVGLDGSGAAAQGQSAELQPPAPYTIVSGDTLWGIAEAHLGAGNRWQEIYNANRGQLGDDPNLIFPGTQILITARESEPVGSSADELMDAAECGEPYFQHIVLRSGAALGALDLELASTHVEAALLRWDTSAQCNPSWISLHAYYPGFVGIILEWQPKWGEVPTTVDYAGSLEPLEARLAVQAAQQSVGWSSVAADMQPQVEALLGGEINAQSRQARAYFLTLYGDPGWASQGATAQASILEGLLTEADARPQLVPSIGGAQPAPYTLSAATLVANHQFNGIQADADRYTVTCETTTATIFSPHVPDTTQGHFHSVEQAAIAFASLPAANRAVVNSVTLNAQQNPQDAYWATQYDTPNFRSYMTAGAAGNVTIYPTGSAGTSQLTMSTSMIHETGHTWSKQQWGEDTTAAAWAPWRAAMASDRISVSDYATNSLNEDVAETIRAFCDSKGTPQHAEYRAMVPARFDILNDHF
ncbi:MAG: hypothetical protein ACI9U2_000668 [Bradymonadia bacterium]|jgi:hypothetical protein